MNNIDSVSLIKIIDDIKDGIIMIPDFQRRFVWKELDRQKLLVASVLANIPIGSMLYLKANSEEYAYKLLGGGRIPKDDAVQSQDILALIDGQQRMTVLSNVFSNVIFNNKYDMEIKEKSLMRRFFLKIPKLDCKENDPFGIEYLQFPIEDVQTDENKFLSDDILNSIEAVGFTIKDTECYNPKIIRQGAKFKELRKFCLETGDKDFYLIPLFLLCEKKKNLEFLKRIISSISDRRRDDIYSRIMLMDDNEKIKVMIDKFSADCDDALVESSGEQLDDNIKEILQFKAGDWADRLKEYLILCVSSIKLNQIVLDGYERKKVINIYENLNKGGASLGTFELLTAKFGLLSDKNYYDYLLENMKEKNEYPSNLFLDYIKNDSKIVDYITKEDYSATEELGCYNSNDEISPAYIEAYLDVLCLYTNTNKPDSDLESISVNMIKKSVILSMTAQNLSDGCPKVCRAMDFALFFLQMRCGIRDIKSLNYNLMLVVVAYVFLNEEYAKDFKVHSYLEAWYWSAIFSGKFDRDQNQIAIDSIKELLKAIKNNNSKWIWSLSENNLECTAFSEKNFLIMSDSDNTRDYPKAFLGDVICQFYLTQVYCSFWSDAKLTPFSKETLHKHHVIPLNSSPIKNKKKEENSQKDSGYSDSNDNTKISVLEKNLRKNKHHFLNSPLNYAYISDADNRDISDTALEVYVKGIKTLATVKKVGIDGKNIDTTTDTGCRAVLSERFDSFKDALDARIQTLIPQN